MTEEQRLKRNAYMRKWNSLNREKVNEAVANYRKNNPDKIKEQGKRYYDNNKDKVKQYKEDNKERISAVQKEWYHNNLDKVTGYRVARSEERKAILYKYKEGLICLECGEDRLPTLDFHHTDPSTKLFNIAQFVRDGYTEDELLEEMTKCIVLCANCHRMHHHNERS